MPCLFENSTLPSTAEYLNKHTICVLWNVVRFVDGKMPALWNIRLKYKLLNSLGINILSVLPKGRFDSLYLSLIFHNAGIVKY